MTPRTCEQCGDPFEGRADASYCSPACKQRAYRDRRDGTARNTPVVTDSKRWEYRLPPSAWAWHEYTDPVPAVDQHDWLDDRFLSVNQLDRNTLVSKPRLDHRASELDTSAHGTLYEVIEHYVFEVASVVTRDIRNDREDDLGYHRYEYRLDGELPDELPSEITPHEAETLASWLEPALDRAEDLLVLLRRRAAAEPPERGHP